MGTDTVQTHSPPLWEHWHFKICVAMKIIFEGLVVEESWTQSGVHMQHTVPTAWAFCMNPEGRRTRADNIRDAVSVAIATAARMGLKLHPEVSAHSILWKSTT